VASLLAGFCGFNSETAGLPATRPRWRVCILQAHWSVTLHQLVRAIAALCQQLQKLLLPCALDSSGSRLMQRMHDKAGARCPVSCRHHRPHNCNTLIWSIHNINAFQQQCNDLQGGLWRGVTDHPYSGASHQQLHRQHQRECQRTHGSCQLEPVPG